MQMSEPFATTIAAVAPVVWLVGAVEYHQVAKRTAEAYKAGEVLLTQTVEELQRAGDAEILAHQWTETQQQTLRPPKRLLPLHALWSAVTACLLSSLVNALAWLAKGDEQDKASGEAMFCFCTLCGSFIIVTAVPVATALTRMSKSSDRRHALRQEIERLQADARRRVETDQVSPPA
ncbi:hypothetical protein AB0I06_02920 [Streptomyces sp. NPDC050674]|uniref:hypothetical protein n=1 Tax=Streptomyces sp. NPDC050674 TaxID=3157216 RepID=UPI00342D5995